jgi:multidrug efflux pump subunit AcrA (membrane-fusion protein)
MKRWIALGAVVIVVGGGGGVAYALTRSSSSSGSTPPTTTTVTVSKGTVQQSVTTTGTIEPKQDEDLSFGVSGRVTSVAAVVGKKVGKGTVLATLDSTTLQSAVTTKTAAVTAAELELSAVSGSSATQVAAAKAQLAQAENELTSAEDDLAAASLTAPFTGTVAAVDLAVGDVVGSSNPQGSGSTDGTITLITTDAWIVNASVGSADLAQLKKGQQAQITPTGATQKVFGTISSIGIVASSSSSGSATFPVVVSVTGSPTGLSAGGSADVVLVVRQLSDVLTVPTLAVSTSSDGTTQVTKVVNGKAVKTAVVLGDSYGASTVVTSGLSEGDTVQLTFARPAQRRTTTGNSTGGNGGPGGGFQGPPGGGTFQFSGPGQ